MLQHASNLPATTHKPCTHTHTKANGANCSASASVSISGSSASHTSRARSAMACGQTTTTKGLNAEAAAAALAQQVAYSLQTPPSAFDKPAEPTWVMRIPGLSGTSAWHSVRSAAVCSRQQDLLSYTSG